jgi:hypothetical protein
MVFSDTVNNLGIVQQARSFARVDSTQWPTYKIVNSANNWHDKVVGYAIGSDKRFSWDDTNHTKLPEGTTDLTINVSDYSFLTDEQGNAIVTLTGVSRLISGSNYEPLRLIDRNDPDYDAQNFGVVSGTPTAYDKIADNIIRLDTKPSDTVTGGLKFYFQRVGSYFSASDTTKPPGVSPLIHRGYVIAAAYDIALTLGLPNLQPLSVELQKEEQKMIQYFADRNNDERKQMTMSPIRFR